MQGGGSTWETSAMGQGWGGSVCPPMGKREHPSLLSPVSPQDCPQWGWDPLYHLQLQPFLQEGAGKWAGLGLGGVPFSMSPSSTSNIPWARSGDLLPAGAGSGKSAPTPAGLARCPTHPWKSPAEGEFHISQAGPGGFSSEQPSQAKPRPAGRGSPG